MPEKSFPSTMWERPLDQRQATRELFRNRDFRLLWVGQLLSQVGDQCLLIAAITLISNFSNSPMARYVCRDGARSIGDDCAGAFA